MRARANFSVDGSHFWSLQGFADVSDVITSRASVCTHRKLLSVTQVVCSGLCAGVTVCWPNENAVRRLLGRSDFDYEVGWNSIMKRVVGMCSGLNLCGYVSKVKHCMIRNSQQCEESSFILPNIVDLNCCCLAMRTRIP
jgi:hypothetical protein